ncbi:MAG TPA: DNA polymerase Y family protein, partial [Acidimicrobiales bacterium]|nr:DNA polymerase Y family protein [Acidimicrobiales bacterium]
AVATVVVRANRVVAASAGARGAGVAVGMRRREAQRRCPHVAVLAHDPDRDARCFEPVAAAFDVLTPGVEVSVPGTLAFATRGPSRYVGGDHALAERTGWIATGATGGAEVGVGVADGAFAALLAARRAVRRGEPVVVAPGGSPDFLAPLPVAALTQAALDIPVPADLTDLFARLGLRTLGQVAALDGADLLGRFGEVGALVHRLARGLDPRPLQARRPAPELQVTREIDPPAEQADRAAFVARVLAGELHERLAAGGLACTRVLVEAETDHGEILARHWRHEGALTPAALTDRVRWQIDGWLTGSAAVRPTAGIVRLTLVPVEVVAARGRQLGFWGGETLVDERILRAVARLQGTLGAGSVRVAEIRGGRSPADRVVQIPVEAVDLTAPRPAAHLHHVPAPWPGRVPDPAPASVLADPEPVEVVDAGGRPVGVTGRAEVTAPPARLTRPGRRPQSLTGWAGPWPVEERWWDPARHRRRARFQLVDDTGTAHLVAVEAGRWWLEAVYD